MRTGSLGGPTKARLFVRKEWGSGWTVNLARLPGRRCYRPWTFFITIAFCTEVALFAICGGLFVEHEWRRDAHRVDADPQELARLATRAPSGYPATAAKPPTIAP